MKRELRVLLLFVGAFALLYNLPVESERFTGAVLEALKLVRWYAREHVLLCLVPAFFIAGAISVFVSQASVMKYLGAGANKVLAYGVASVSGGILAVCSCTVLPLFAGIYRMGAGLGPACAFLYSGPAINVLAIVLTARVLGVELGVVRGVAAVSFSVLVGLVMAFLFREEEKEKALAQASQPPVETKRPLWLDGLFFASMVGVLVFANWGKPDTEAGLWALVYGAKWWLTAAFAVLLAVLSVLMFQLKAWEVLLAAVGVAALAAVFRGNPVVPFAAGTAAFATVLFRRGGEAGEWLSSSWTFAKMILPLLFGGVLAAGFFLGTPGGEGIIPGSWVASLVGGNSLAANFFASVSGAFMYFATLTEVPIVQGLLNAGMGKGPALALLLAGPALSLPNMLVIRSIMGTKKTVVFVSVVVVMATLSGAIYGALF